ncbi:MAG TPA: exopolysaccharide biosynthesis polyprenyl glycosylphosphotransferase [Phenylobacterium sp.]|nr:exopolysaccharide biosynthesis polyprenyl glycosylphosphotransferase [Phenylobacterium sp.]
MPFDEVPTLEAPAGVTPPSGCRRVARENGSDRRGPLRPKILAPTRLRLAGRLVTRLFQGGDGLALIGGGLAVYAQTGGAPHSLTVSAAGALAVMAALSLFNTYAFSARRGLLRHLAVVWTAFAMGASVAALALLAVAPPALLTPVMQVWAPTAWALVTGLHAAWWLLVRHWRASGRLTPNIVVVGATGSAERLIAAMLKSREANILGMFDDRAARSPRSIAGVPVLGGTQALLDHRIMPFVDRIVISVPSAARVRVAELIERLRVLPNEITLLLDGEDAADEAAAIGRIADVPLALISGPPANEVRALIKRAQDVVVGTLALLFALPIMVVVAIAIRMDSPGPALFRQRRHGFNNEEIVVWKFRSMKVESADARATRQISANDDRVTRVGRIIRRTSLDELPQIFNVLTGQMSLVGPRPHAIGMMTGDVESARLVAEYAHRHRMKPGMTGWAAIHGSRGPVDTPELVQRRVALDVEYIQRQSFWLDLWIMLVTIPCLLGDSEAVR